MQFAVIRPQARFVRQLDHLRHPVVTRNEASTAASREVNPNPFDENDHLPAEID